MEERRHIKRTWDGIVRNHYVYAHYTADTNKLFYIGIGTHRPGDTIGRKYLRAYSCAKSARNRYWLGKYMKHGRTVVILYDNLTEKEAKEKEIELIAEHGTYIKRTGTLCNITEGGEGRFGDNSMCKKIYVYNLQGVLIKEFNSCLEAAESLKLDRRNIGVAANRKRKTCGGYQFRYEENKDVDIHCFNSLPHNVSTPLLCKNIETGEEKYFPSQNEFARFIGVSTNSHIHEALHHKRNRKIVKGWEVKYADV